METRAYATSLAVTALVLFGAGDGPSQTRDQRDGRTSEQHDDGKMDMSGTMNEPHRLLAMAYLQNIATFARALHNQPDGHRLLNAEFARGAVAEMKRSRGEMEEHHRDHLKTMSEAMRAEMAAMIEDTDRHRALLKDAISALAKDVRAEPLDSKQVSAGCASVLKQVDELSNMHNGRKASKATA
jgi:hypothetical protein